MSCIIITDHAKNRTKERIGLPKRVIEKNAERAFAEGIRHNETSGGLKRFLDGLYLNGKKANNLRIYCGNVYLFCGNVLIRFSPRHSEILNLFSSRTDHPTIAEPFARNTQRRISESM